MLPNYSKAKRKFSIFAEEGPSLEAPTSHRRKIQANERSGRSLMREEREFGITSGVLVGNNMEEREKMGATMENNPFAPPKRKRGGVGNIFKAKENPVSSSKYQTPTRAKRYKKSSAKRAQATPSQHIFNFATSRKSAPPPTNVEVKEKEGEREFLDDISSGDDDSVNVDIGGRRESNYSSMDPSNTPTTIIREPLRLIFPYRHFNKVQSECLPLLYPHTFSIGGNNIKNIKNKNKNNNVELCNLVVTSPTGSGKTVLLELAICQLFHTWILNRMSASTQKGGLRSMSKDKAVYLGPIRALCYERAVDWRVKFGRLGLGVVEITGETEEVNWDQLKHGNIIVTTPEKWDSLTRHWKEHKVLGDYVKLLLIDEVHALANQRGATLEAVVARTAIISNYNNMHPVRIIALSATVPNVDDVRQWIQVIANTQLKIFGEEYRPVKLEKIVLGFEPRNNEFLFEKHLNYRLGRTINTYSEGKPVLVFCQTKNGAIAAATQLKGEGIGIRCRDDRAQFEILSRDAKDKALKENIKGGIGFHHGGLIQSDRHLVESLFESGKLKVVCTTTTLAQGINLPARLVVLKGTMAYRGSSEGYQEYSPIEIEQIMGRAGRPQYDNRGIAVIMTQKAKVRMYEELTSQDYVVESTLAHKMIEYLNAEISLGTLQDLESCQKWIKSTFMYVRMNKNPKYYSIKPGCTVEEHLKKILIEMIVKLSEYDLISYKGVMNTQNPSLKEITNIQSKELGFSMAKFYIAFETMTKIYNCGNTIEAILWVVASAKENEKFTSKREDRKVLNTINKDPNCRYKISGCIGTYEKKAFSLIQAALSWINFESWNLKLHQAEIVRTGERILKCIKEVFINSGDSKGIKVCLLLQKCFHQKLWHDSKYEVKQVPKIGEKYARILGDNGLESLIHVGESYPNKIEGLTGKNPPFGTDITSFVRSITQYRLDYEFKEEGKNTYALYIYLQRVNEAMQKEAITHYHLLVAGLRDGALIYYQFINSWAFNTLNVSKEYKCTIPPYEGKVSISLISDKFIGMDEEHVITCPGDLYSRDYNTMENPEFNESETEILKLLDEDEEKREIMELLEEDEEEREIIKLLDEYDIDRERERERDKGENIERNKEIWDIDDINKEIWDIDDINKEIWDIDDINKENSDLNNINKRVIPNNFSREAKERRKEEIRPVDLLFARSIRKGCKHLCKNKYECKHECCKIGLVKKKEEHKYVQTTLNKGIGGLLGSGGNMYMNMSMNKNSQLSTALPSTQYTGQGNNTLQRNITSTYVNTTNGQIGNSRNLTHNNNNNNPRCKNNLSKYTTKLGAEGAREKEALKFLETPNFGDDDSHKEDMGDLKASPAYLVTPKFPDLHSDYPLLNNSASGEENNNVPTNNGLTQINIYNQYYNNNENNRALSPDNWVEAPRLCPAYNSGEIGTNKGINNGDNMNYRGTTPQSPSLKVCKSKTPRTPRRTPTPRTYKAHTPKRGKRTPTPTKLSATNSTNPAAHAPITKISPRQITNKHNTVSPLRFNTSPYSLRSTQTTHFKGQELSPTNVERKKSPSYSVRKSMIRKIEMPTSKQEILSQYPQGDIYSQGNNLKQSGGLLSQGLASKTSLNIRNNINSRNLIHKAPMDDRLFGGALSQIKPINNNIDIQNNREQIVVNKGKNQQKDIHNIHKIHNINGMRRTERRIGAKLGNKLETILECEDTPEYEIPDYRNKENIPMAPHILGLYRGQKSYMGGKHIY